jgi:hypothetical protein
MTGTTQRDRPVNHRRQWLAHVEAQKKSGLNRTEYCKQYNLSYHAMTYWTHKGHSSPETKTTLVPVPVERNSLPYSSRCSHPALRINLSREISVEVGDNFSASTLTRLLDTLEAR